MTSTLSPGLFRDLKHCIAIQEEAVTSWHTAEPVDIPQPEGNDPTSQLRTLVLCQHLRNFRLWHVEDTARRSDVDAAVIADCKRRIDGLNQQRNDFIEQVDNCLVERLRPYLPVRRAGRRGRLNTESMGMAVDRLSILALKVYHMREQTERQDADATHIASCVAKLAVLREQRADLQQALLDLVEDYFAGRKKPKVYYQFKMYNDPALNPELYAKKS